MVRLLMNTIGTIKEVIPETFLFCSENGHLQKCILSHLRGVGRLKNLAGPKCVSQIHEIRVNPLAERNWEHQKQEMKS